jgi:hypothetical protein
MIVVRANGEDGRTRGGVVRGNDVYGLTAVTTVHGAVLLAAPDFAGAGVHGPAGVFDPVAFLNYLTDHGLAWETS